VSLSLIGLTNGLLMIEFGLIVSCFESVFCKWILHS
jgi:hypothetical protein